MSSFKSTGKGHSVLQSKYSFRKYHFEIYNVPRYADIKYTDQRVCELTAHVNIFDRIPMKRKQS